MAARVLLLITLVTKALAAYDQTPRLHADEGSPDAEAEAASCQLLQMASGLRPQVSEANATSTLPDPVCNAEMREAKERWAAAYEKSLIAEGIKTFIEMMTCHSHLGLPEIQRWSSMMFASAATSGKPAYRDSMVSTVDGVYPLDAAWCKVTGFLDLPNKSAILNNYNAIMAMSSRFCAAYGVYKTTISMYELSRVPGGPIDLEKRYSTEAQKLTSERIPPLAGAVLTGFNWLLCSAGTLPCNIQFCLQHFCTLADGRIGMGCQCNVTHLSPPASP